MGRKTDLMPNSQFIVILGLFQIGFSKVSNMEASMECETVSEGGLSTPHIFSKPKGQTDKLILERGIYRLGQNGIMNLLIEGCRLADVIILVKGVDQTIERSFGFANGTVVSRKFSDLNAVGNDVFIETLEIAHDGLIYL